MQCFRSNGDESLRSGAGQLNGDSPSRKPAVQAGFEKAPTSAVFNSSFELLWYIWNGTDGVRLPVKACRLPTELGVPCLQFTVKGRDLESRA
jgi:hypothetical protein